MDLSRRIGHRAGIDQVYRELKHVLELAEHIETTEADKDRGQEDCQQRLEALVKEAQEWLSCKPLRLSCDRLQSPATWVTSILAWAEKRSDAGIEQRLVCATLQCRHPSLIIPNEPVRAVNAEIGRLSGAPFHFNYHVTATDGKEAVERCGQNVEMGVHPVLLVPKRYVDKTTIYAELAGIQNRISILAIEDFITQNIIEISTHPHQDFFTTLKAIINEYNRRLEEVETDMSLKIELS